jgi:hypothetical protein
LRLVLADILFSDLDEKHSFRSSSDSIMVITGLWRETFTLGEYSYAAIDMAKKVKYTAGKHPHPQTDTLGTNPAE